MTSHFIFFYYSVFSNFTQNNTQQRHKHMQDAFNNFCTCLNFLSLSFGLTLLEIKTARHSNIFLIELLNIKNKNNARKINTDAFY